MSRDLERWENEGGSWRCRLCSQIDWEHDIYMSEDLDSHGCPPPLRVKPCCQSSASVCPAFQYCVEVACVYEFCGGCGALEGVDAVENCPCGLEETSGIQN